MEVLLFGIARDIVGAPEIRISTEDLKIGSVKELKALLSKTYPDFGKLSSLAVAVNSEYATDELLLKSTDEIAIIPPVSGG